ncbi:uncharacterized protein LOC143282980 [Babylonia areolata]|uniref:uncharacterized protein LOC143282980 n=1 Tax=Babylonia areolata TaxID=304850 RepID=UPI003FD5A6CA
MPSNFLSSFEESNPHKKEVVELWLFENVDDSQQRKQLACFRNSTSFYSTSLPDIRKWQPDFKMRVLSAIVDRDMKEDLVKVGLINWCRNVRSLLPVSVPKDGNCLLHAVGTAVWGVTDSSLMLRRLLCLTLSVDHDHRFQDRWLHHWQRQLTQTVDRLLDTSTELMNKEWTEIRQCLEPNRSQSVAVPHRFLEPIHVYTLANILRRPIIVLADSAVRTVRGLSVQDDDRGGIYLPLEWECVDTCRMPILLGCSHSHFCPLLFADHPNQTLMESNPKRDLTPLVNSRFEQLPVRFLLPQEEPEVGHLLRRYLKVRETVMQVEGRVQNVLCAELEGNSLPAELSLVQDFIQDCVQRFQHGTKPFPSLRRHHSHNAAITGAAGTQECPQLSASGPPEWLIRNVRREQLQGAHTPQMGLGDPTLHTAAQMEHQINIPPPSVRPIRNFGEQSVSLNPSPEEKCVMPGCKFFGDPDLGMMCSSCFKTYTIRESRHVAAVGSRPLPTAPLASMPAGEGQLQLSMMNERCKEKCGYRCSTKTFPYCYECASKKQKEAQEASAMAEQSAGSAQASTDREKTAAQPGTCLSAQRPQESREVSGTEAQSPSVLSQPPVTGPPGGEARAGHSPLSSTQTQEEAMEAPGPLPSSEDPHILQLLGSGQASTAVTSHPEQGGSAMGGEPLTLASSGPAVVPVSTEQEAGVSGQKSQQQMSGSDSEQNLLSAATLFKGGLNREGGDTPAECRKQGCRGPAVHQNLCGMCYVSQDLKNLELANQTEPLKREEPLSLTEQKMFSIQSSSSSDPSVRPATGPKSCATYTKLAGGWIPPESKSQPTSLRDLSNIPPATYINSWMQGSRFADSQPAAVTETVEKSPPQGLPEKPESEVGNNDLIASGAECCSSTQRCIGVGCGNAVPEAGKLCQQCQDILRHARQAQGASAGASEQAGSRNTEHQQCVTEGCSYFGAPQNFGYCTRCYREHVQREVEQETHHSAPSPAHQHQHHQPTSGTITVPPDFNYVVTPQDRHGRPCTAAGCRLYGDPGHADMCFTHYQQHLSTIAKATHRLAASTGRPQVTSVGYASQVRITPTSITLYGTGNVLPPSQVSFPPPSLRPPNVAAPRWSPSLGETYYRVAGRHTGNCLNPSCTNYGNRDKGGLCNSCAQEQRFNDEMIRRSIYGDEETG